MSDSTANTIKINGIPVGYIGTSHGLGGFLAATSIVTEALSSPMNKGDYVIMEKLDRIRERVGHRRKYRATFHS